MSVIWGIPYLLIKVAVREVSPVDLVFFRTALASILLVPLAASRGALRPALARWRPLVVYTLAELAIPWLLVSGAERRLPSSLTGLLVAAVPIVGVPVGVLVGRRAELSRRNVAGLALGLVGVAALVGFGVDGAQAGAAGLMAVVVVGYATGPAVASRWLADVPSLGVAALSALVCALGYAPFAIPTLPGRLDGSVIASVAILGVVCTAVAFVVFFALIAEVGALRATVVTYLNPAVAVVLGVAFLGETVGASTLAGFALVLAGSWMATSPRPDPAGVGLRGVVPAGVAGAGIVGVAEVAGAGSACTVGEGSEEGLDERGQR
jgi:drug/metabolite transporter (DMT)-like permease